jgi:hypothetical protein
MIRLHLREIEEALANPAEYRAKLTNRVVSNFRYSYFLALRNAIFRYHRPDTTLIQAREYLSDSLAGFKNASRADDTMDQFDWYVEHHHSCGLKTFDTRLMVEVPVPPQHGRDLACSGQVDRLDIRPSGGYAAWLFRSKDHLNWTVGLRMPLTQLAVAKKLDIDSQEVTIGIYSFHERYVEAIQYSTEEIAYAYTNFVELLSELDL